MFSALPDYLVCISTLSAHKAAGAASARHSLRPLFEEGHRIARLGRKIAPRECGVLFEIESDSSNRRPCTRAKHHNSISQVSPVRSTPKL